jgi:hypothetical protein
MWKAGKQERSGQQTKRDSAEMVTPHGVAPEHSAGVLAAGACIAGGQKHKAQLGEERGGG